MSVDTERVPAAVDDPPAFLSHRIPYPATVDRQSIIWGYMVAIVAFHLLLPLAFVPWLFSWTGLLLIPIGNYVFGVLGIIVGYHRLLTHQGYKCPKWVEHTLALLGVCNLQDSPARWVAIHRLHHQHADDQPDPHSPLAHWFWGHAGWLLVENTLVNRIATYEKYARDVLEDPFYIRLERGRFWLWIYAAHAVLFYLVGMTIGWISTGRYMGGVQFGLSLLLWGVVFRTIYTWHLTWGVNSLCHLRGYRNYDTRDNSRNNLLWGVLTHGEGFHNNHHAEPRSMMHGHRWWELDLSYHTIRLLERLGLAWDLVLPKPRNRPR